MRHVLDKDKKAIIADMKPIYQTNDGQQGYQRLLEEKWGKKYLLSCKSCLDNWVNLSAFLITTMAIEKLSTPLILSREYIGTIVKCLDLKTRSYLPSDLV